MDGLDGFGLYKRILEMDGKIKVCFMSGYDYRDALSKFQRKHRIPSERYLQKPLNVDRFIGLVRETIASIESSQHDGPSEHQFV